MVAAEHTILIEEMNQNKICGKQRLKAFYLSIIVLLATVILMLIETDSSNRILGFKFENEIEKCILVNNSKSTKYFDSLKAVQDFIWNKLDDLQ